MNCNHESIRQFYRQKLEEHGSAYLPEIWKDLQIARVELLTLGDSDVFNMVEIESINQEVPVSLQSAFERHIWFSQHCLTDIYILRVEIKASPTYAVFVSGYVHDGWDGYCNLLEVYDEAGEFVASTSIYSEKDFAWLDKPFNVDTFLNAPPGLSPGSSVEYAAWSEEKASRIEQHGSITRLVMPWANTMN